MISVLKTFEDGSVVSYCKGRFDDWCVYYVSSDGKSHIAPKDTDYFDVIENLDLKYCNSIVYDFIYNILINVTDVVDNEILSYINLQSRKLYSDEFLEADKNITFIYV